MDAKGLVTGATTATATSAASAKAPGGSRRAVGTGRGEDGKLNRGFLTGAFREGDLLLLIDDNFFKALVAFIADVFVDRHEAIPS